MKLKDKSESAIVGDWLQNHCRDRVESPCYDISAAEIIVIWCVVPTMQKRKPKGYTRLVAVLGQTSEAALGHKVGENKDVHRVQEC